MTLRRISLPGTCGSSVFIQTSDAGGVVSRLADSIEERQVDGARVFLEVLAPVMAAGNFTVEEAAVLLSITADHLRDVVGVAEARAARLPGSDAFGDDEEEASAG